MPPHMCVVSYQNRCTACDNIAGNVDPPQIVWKTTTSTDDATRSTCSGTLHLPIVDVQIGQHLPIEGGGHAVA
jgi:hypothetical protein